MQMNKINAKSLKEIVATTSDKIVHNHMSNITIINAFDFFITFSNYRKEKLLISLNPNNPFLCLVEIKNPCGTKLSNLNDVLRKEVKDGFIISFQTVNNDRVVSLKYCFTNDYYEKEYRELIIELIPHRPNIIMLNEEKTILFAYHYTDLANEHPVVKGLKYQELENKNVVSDIDFSYDVYQKFANDYYHVALRKRLEEQFKPVLTHIKSRIKGLKQKLKVLDKEIETATDNLKNQEIGQMILTYSYNENDLKEYVKENIIEYDWSLSSGVNANKYFQKYKKAKRTIEMDQIEITKTHNEIEYLETCLAQTQYMDESDIIELANLLFPHKFKINSKKKIDAKPSEVVVDGIRICYGKNSKQNDLLTFKKAQKFDWWFHVKNVHGSHVVVMDANPSKEIILVACEIALLLSGQDSGDVQSTRVKNIKKGSFLGQALLSSYITYTINGVRESTKRLIQN